MPIYTILKDAVRIGIENAMSDDIQEIVAKETRRAMRLHEEQLTEIVRNAVTEAIDELLQPKKLKAHGGFTDGREFGP
jgi:hypothetical protein